MPPAAPIPQPHPRRPFASLRSIGALMLREMATTYGRSPGGYVWAILEPVGGIALLSAIFAIGFQAPELGRSFVLFHATGLVPFLLYTTISARVATALLYSRALLAYPAVSHLDAIFARFLLNAATQFLVAGLIFAGILILFDTQSLPDPAPIALGLGLAAFLGLGVGTLNCFLFTAFPVWQSVWSVLMRPLFLVSGVFYTLEAVLQPWRDMLWFNPLNHVVGLVRRGFYPGYHADLAAPLFVAVVALVCLVLGLLLMRNRARDLVQD